MRSPNGKFMLNPDGEKSFRCKHCLNLSSILIGIDPVDMLVCPSCAHAMTECTHVRVHSDFNGALCQMTIELPSGKVDADWCRVDWSQPPAITPPLSR